MKKHSPKKILAIDDERAMRDYYIYLLKDSYEVTAVPSNELAISLLLKDRFNLIISDIKRPGGDGIQLLQFLIDNPEVMPRKILYISGFIRESLEDLNRAMDQVNDLLVGMMKKPFKANQLHRNIIKMLNGVVPRDI